jgi:hypothetical protein
MLCWGLSALRIEKKRGAPDEFAVVFVNEELMGGRSVD